MDLKGFDLEHWWKMLCAVGVAIIVASIIGKFIPTIFIGLGLLFVGIGEWINHPSRQYPTIGTAYFPSAIITDTSRQSSLSGLAMDTIGIVLFFFGLWRMYWLA